jgi:hypothetical protein
MSSRLDKLFQKAIEEASIENSGSGLLQKFEEFICDDSNTQAHKTGVHKAFNFKIPLNFRGEPVKALKAYFEDKKFVENTKCTSSYNMPPCQFAFTREVFVCQWQQDITICAPEYSTEVVICF